MWRLDRRHWSLLAALDLDGSLTAAAEGLGITQSAASQRLREAERRMGVPLIVRRGRGVMLNAAGARLATAGAALEASLSTAEADALWVGRRRRPRLRLAQDHHDSPSVAAAVARICAGCGVDLEIVRCAAADVASRLLSGDADAAVLPHEAELPGIAAEPLFDDRLVAVAPAAVPWRRSRRRRRKTSPGTAISPTGCFPDRGGSTRASSGPEPRFQPRSRGSNRPRRSVPSLPTAPDCRSCQNVPCRRRWLGFR